MEEILSALYSPQGCLYQREKDESDLYISGGEMCSKGPNESCEVEKETEVGSEEIWK